MQLLPVLEESPELAWLARRIAAKSALALQGVRHNLATREQWVLWGDVRFALPEWFTTRFPARYVSARLFDWPDEALDE